MVLLSVGSSGSRRLDALLSPPPDKTVKLWKVSERDKRPEGYNLKDEDGRLRDPSMITVLRVSVGGPWRLGSRSLRGFGWKLLLVSPWDWQCHRAVLGWCWRASSCQSRGCAWRTGVAEDEEAALDARAGLGLGRWAASAVCVPCLLPQCHSVLCCHRLSQ